MEAEVDNVRAVLTWSIDRNEPIVGLRLACALYDFWIQPYRPAREREAMVWLKRLLALDGDTPLALRANALVMLAEIELREGDIQLALEYGQEGLSLARQSGDRAVEGMALFALSYPVFDLGDQDQGVLLQEQSLAIWRELDRPYWIASALQQIGESKFRQGQYSVARGMYEAALDISRTHGDHFSIAFDLHFLAGAEFSEGTYIDAARHWQESLSICEDLRLTWGIANVVSAAAELAEKQGAPGQGVRLLSAAQRVRVSIGLPVVWPSDRTYSDGVISRLEAQLGSDLFAVAWTEGEAMALDDAIAETKSILARPIAVQQSPDSPDLEHRSGLTPRELEVLRLLADGLTNRKVAGALFISHRTVDNHVSNMLHKLDAATSREAVAKARRLDILS